tara:strand:- start:166 stop:579 length:414 start_codon:yes stop_codon:yes gene_type:complete
LKQIIKNLEYQTSSKKIEEITNDVEARVSESKISNGLLNLSVLHTSCSLMIQENADQTVLKDIRFFLDQIAPEQDYFHNTEGPDDMPAHLKSMLTQSNLTISVRNRNLVLGTWQGIFLLEHRISNKKRDILFHLIGD